MTGCVVGPETKERPLRAAPFSLARDSPDGQPRRRLRTKRGKSSLSALSSSGRPLSLARPSSRVHQRDPDGVGSGVDFGSGGIWPICVDPTGALPITGAPPVRDLAGVWADWVCAGACGGVPPANQA